MNKKVTWIIVAVLAAVVLFFIFGKGPVIAPPDGTPVGGSEPAAQGEIVASDNPDTIVANILDSAQIDLTPIESDPTLTAPDTDITGGFDQAADTSNL